MKLLPARQFNDILVRSGITDLSRSLWSFILVFNFSLSFELCNLLVVILRLLYFFTLLSHFLQCLVLFLAYFVVLPHVFV